MDLAMEMANLQTIQPGGTAPVSVINQYLNTINGFYENQIQNLIGPRTHAINDQIVFDNNTRTTIAFFNRTSIPIYIISLFPVNKNKNKIKK